MIFHLSKHKYSTLYVRDYNDNNDDDDYMKAHFFILSFSNIKKLLSSFFFCWARKKSLFYDQINNSNFRRSLWWHIKSNRERWRWIWWRKATCWVVFVSCCIMHDIIFLVRNLFNHLIIWYAIPLYFFIQWRNITKKEEEKMRWSLQKCYEKLPSTPRLFIVVVVVGVVVAARYYIITFF